MRGGGAPKNGGQACQALGRSRGGFSTKIHVSVDGLGNPLRFILTGGQRHDITQAEELIAGYAGEQVLADKGYDSQEFREHEEEILPARPGAPAGSGQRQLSSGWRTSQLRTLNTWRTLVIDQEVTRWGGQHQHCNSLGNRHLLFGGQGGLRRGGCRPFVALKQGVQALGTGRRAPGHTLGSALTHESRRDGRALNDNYAERPGALRSGHAKIPREWRGRAGSLPVVSVDQPKGWATALRFIPPGRWQPPVQGKWSRNAH